MPLLLSGKIAKGNSSLKKLEIEDTLSIQFYSNEEVKDPNDSPHVYEKPYTSHVVIGKKRRIPPKPFV